MAEEMDSPFAVTSAASAAIIMSREAGLEFDINFFQGPGESPDNSGDGRGVTSAIAFSMGDERAELGAEPIFELLPMLVARTFFTLGVRDIGGLAGLRAWVGLRVVLAAVTV